jgi:hypothetical protein
VKTGRKIGIQPLVIAEIAKSQMGQMHPEELAVLPRTVSPFLIQNSPGPFSRPESAHTGL